MTLLTTGVLLTATGLASYFDLTAKRIPNWISASTLAYGITAHFWIEGGRGVVMSLGGMALGGTILLVPYLLGGMGAGDVKLLAAIGSVVGPSEIMVVFILAALAGGLLALFVVVWRKQLVGTAIRFMQLFIDLRSPGKLSEEGSVGIPYGVAISIGTWMFVGMRGLRMKWIVL